MGQDWGQAKPWLNSNCKGGIRNCKTHSKQNPMTFVLKTNTIIEIATLKKKWNFQKIRTNSFIL